MPPKSDAVLPGAVPPERCELVARVAAMAAIAIGLAVLAGWTFDIRALMTVLPGFVAMKPNTALGFCASGWSILLFLPTAGPASARRRRLSLALAGGVALLGGLTAGGVCHRLQPGHR